FAEVVDADDRTAVRQADQQRLVPVAARAAEPGGERLGGRRRRDPRAVEPSARAAELKDLVAVARRGGAEEDAVTRFDRRGGGGHGATLVTVGRVAAGTSGHA